MTGPDDEDDSDSPVWGAMSIRGVAASLSGSCLTVVKSGASDSSVDDVETGSPDLSDERCEGG